MELTKKYILEFLIAKYVISCTEWTWLFWFPTQNGHGYFGQIISFGEKHVFEKSSWDRLLFLKCGLSVFLSSLLETAHRKAQVGRCYQICRIINRRFRSQSQAKKTLCCSLSTNTLLIQAEERMFFELIFQGYKWICNDLSSTSVPPPFHFNQYCTVANMTKIKVNLWLWDN